MPPHRRARERLQQPAASTRMRHELCCRLPSPAGAQPRPQLNQPRQHSQPEHATMDACARNPNKNKNTQPHMHCSSRHPYILTGCNILTGCYILTGCRILTYSRAVQPLCLRASESLFRIFFHGSSGIHSWGVSLFSFIDMYYHRRHRLCLCLCLGSVLVAFVRVGARLAQPAPTTCSHLQRRTRKNAAPTITLS